MSISVSRTQCKSCFTFNIYLFSDTYMLQSHMPSTMLLYRDSFNFASENIIQVHLIDVLLFNIKRS